MCSNVVYQDVGKVLRYEVSELHINPGEVATFGHNTIYWSDNIILSERDCTDLPQNDV